MEYLQVKTPAIEKWEKEMEEILHNGEFKTDAVLSCWEKEFQDEWLVPHMSTPPINYGEIFKDGLFKDTLKKSVKEMDVSVSDTTKKRKLPEGPESTQAENQLRREMHNATEKRRREKINSKIAELRDLIPSAKNFGNNKSSVLQTAVEHIKQLNANYNQLLAANRQLQETNTQLLNELRELHRLLWTRARDQGLEQAAGATVLSPSARI